MMNNLQPLVNNIKDIYFDIEKKITTELDSEFKKRYSLEQRLLQSEKIRNRYPDRIPIIIERYNKSLPKLDKKKYLVPADLTLGNFLYVIRKRLKFSSEKSLFLFVNNKLIPLSHVLFFVYDRNRDKDGFLYVKYCEENTFG